MWGRFWLGVIIYCGFGYGFGYWLGLGSAAAQVATAGDKAAEKPAAVALPAGAERVLSKPAFTATPGELLAIAKSIPADDSSATALRWQRDISYDERGRATQSERWIYVVQDEEDLDDDEWASVSGSWAPRHQDKPVIRARTIKPSGEVVTLDPAQITDVTPPGAPAGNRRFLNAVLPATSRGAVVEWEVAVRDREPASPVGSVHTATFRTDLQVATTVISYTAPVSLKLRRVERKLPRGARMRHQVVSGRDVWTYEIPPQPAKVVDLDGGEEIAFDAYIGVATAASWSAVAREYRRRIDQQIADGPVALHATLPRTPSVEAVRAITAWVHGKVQINRTDHDDASPVPLPPSETLARREGSDVDKAVVLVALLRAAGMRAELVLVSGTWGVPPDPDLPGLGVFHRVAVRARVATRELWIDPTDALMRPGLLAEDALGQPALVIADDTRALSTTPSGVPGEHAIREVRTFVPVEDGPSQLTQVLRATGVIDAQLRRTAGMDGMDDSFRARLLVGASDNLFGGTLDDLTTTTAEDLGTPFEVTARVKDVHRVYTEREQIDAYLWPSAVLTRLPWIVREKSDTPRTRGFVWRMPYVHEVENRITVPPGFTLPAAMAEQTRKLGTATFSERRTIEGRTVIVTFRLDTGKMRITPAELTAMQTAIAALDQEVVHLRIEHTAFELGYAGKPREAIAECRRLIALHPKEALHHGQLATLLVRAGAGEEARREARKAIALEPLDADAYVMLGWVLSHDTLGRRYTYDWDRSGAIGALKVAARLRPQHIGGAFELANVLQRNAAGREDGDEADLPGAIEAWRHAVELDKSNEHVLGLATALLYAGQYAEAETTARLAEAAMDRDKWIVVAVAGRSGSVAAIQTAGELRSGVERDQLLQASGWAAIHVGQYDGARALLTEAGAMARMPPAVATLLGRLAKSPAIKTGASDPRGAALDVLVASVDRSRKTPVFWDADVERDIRNSRELDVALPSPTMGRMLSDMVQSAMRISVEGNDGDGLWRVSVDPGARQLHLYFVRERGAMKLIGATEAVAGVGRYLLRNGSHNGDAKLDARARTLLDWVRADHDKSTMSHLVWFRALWSNGLPTGRDAIQLAAATLANASDPDRVLPIAQSCASTLADAPMVCHQLAFRALVARARWGEAVTEMEALLATRPDPLHEHAFEHAMALARVGRFDDAERMLDEVLAKVPFHPDAPLARFAVAVYRGDAAEALRRGDELVRRPGVTVHELNNVAWYRLGQGGDPTRALEVAHRAVERTPKSAAYVNTLAAIEADAGELGGAVRDNLRAMELRKQIEPSGEDWYVAGRILEQLGLTADAIAAYKRVVRPKVLDPTSTYTYVQKRLTALKAAP
jgi:tetratricopeptide (TPR) repeat protein/transglutaminase-like putative cysteine protease